MAHTTGDLPKLAVVLSKSTYMAHTTGDLVSMDNASDEYRSMAMGPDALQNIARFLDLQSLMEFELCSKTTKSVTSRAWRAFGRSFFPHNTSRWNKPGVVAHLKACHLATGFRAESERHYDFTGGGHTPHIVLCDGSQCSFQKNFFVTDCFEDSEDFDFFFQFSESGTTLFEGYLPVAYQERIDDGTPVEQARLLQRKGATISVDVSGLPLRWDALDGFLAFDFEHERTPYRREVLRGIDATFATFRLVVMAMPSSGTQSTKLVVATGGMWDGGHGGFPVVGTGNRVFELTDRFVNTHAKNDRLGSISCKLAATMEGLFHTLEITHCGCCVCLDLDP
jgi:hypothetical protein